MKGKLIKTDVNYLLEDEYGVVVGSTSLKKENLSLSLKNCQVIERDNPTEEYILEVNGDGWDDHSYKGKRKQTEWDVEIVEECLDKNCDGINKKGECVTTGKPKLDADGCLTLKRI